MTDAPMQEIRDQLVSFGKKLDTLDELKLTMVRVEERQNAQIQTQEHRHANMKQSMEMLATKRDLDVVEVHITAVEQQLTMKIDVLDERMDKAESFQAWIQRAAIGSVVFVATGLAYLGKLLPGLGK